MKARAIKSGELPGLLRLYRFLHPDDPVVDPVFDEVRQHWNNIVSNPLLHIYVCEVDGLLVSTCTLALIPNLSRGLRPYGLIENVVTDPAYQRRGLGTAILRHALTEAWKADCYKVMLETGRKDPGTLKFYETAGFKAGIKTAFIAYPV